MVCIKECPLFEIDLDRLHTDEETYLKRCFNNIKNEISYKISKNIKVEICDENIWWYKNNKPHRDNDQPTSIDVDGTRQWYKNGKYHRDNDQPAIIYFNGTRCWFKNGKIHRDNDQPAIIYSDGSKRWHKNGRRHRDNDKPAVIDIDGTQRWYKNGEWYAPM